MRTEALRRYQREYKRSYRQRAAWKENQARFRAANPERVLVNEARARARRKGIPFDLLPEDIRVPECCPILGIPLTRGTGKHHDNSPTLDRISPELGYVRGNVAVISHRANMIKNCGSASEHELIAAWMKSCQAGVQ